MKKTINSYTLHAFAFCIAFTLGNYAFSQSKEIEFEKGSFSEIKAKAKKENKLIFMDCYTSWCVPCKMMAGETFTNDTVAKYFNEHFINCSFDMEKGEGLKLAKQYNVGCYPNLIFLDGDGNLVHRGAGYKSTGDFIKFTDDALSSQNSFSAVEKNYENNKNNQDATLAYLKNLASSCLDYEEILNNYLSKQKEEDLINENNWNIIKEYVRNYDSREIQYVIKHIESFRKKYPDNVDDFLPGVFLTAVNNYGQDSTKTIKDLENLFSVINKSNIKGFNDTVSLIMKLNFYNQKKDWKSYTALALSDGDRFVSLDNTNEICWNIYLNINDKNLLEKAVFWMEKYMKEYKNYYDWALKGDMKITPDKQTSPEEIVSVAYNYVYAPWDTYASLLYKLKKKKEGKLNAQNAIKVGKRFGLEISETEELLKKIEKL